MQYHCWTSSLHGQPSSRRTPHSLSIIRSGFIHSQDLSNWFKSLPTVLLSILNPSHPSITFDTALFLLLDVSYKTIKIYLAGIRLKHTEREFQDSTNDELPRLLCKGIKHSHGANRGTRLPITINILHTLKCKLREETSYSLLEKRLLWSAFTIAFYEFLRASEFTTPELTWSHIQLHTDKVVVFIQQCKTDPFRQGHTMAIYATETSNCPV